MHHRNRFLALAVAAWLIGCGGDSPTPVEPPVEPPVQPPVQPPPPPPSGLPAGVFALAGIQPGLPHTELEPLREIIGSARFVALGESTHTSRGYYEAKARIIRYMVEVLGFRVVAFENPWIESKAAAAYVATCAGTPEAAMRGFFTVWHDATVRDLLSWLCDYNRTHATDPVTFVGFDIQEPWQSAPAVRAFIAGAAPADTARAGGLFSCTGARSDFAAFYTSQEFRDHIVGTRDHAANERCMRAIADLEVWLEANVAPLASTTSPAAVEEARIALMGLRAWQEQLWIPDPAGYQARDKGMAETLRRLHALHGAGRKTIIWAWNWHIARRYEEVRGFDDDPTRHVGRQGARGMGSFLHDALGTDYRTIALVGYRVETWSNSPPIPTNALSVERRLHALGRAYLLVDLRQPLADTTLLPAGRTLSVSQEWGDPYRQFDALLFLDHSPGMTYLPVRSGPVVGAAAIR